MAEVDGRIEPRQILSLTIIFDYDVIDGALAARFTRRLVELIESGYRLDIGQTLSDRHRTDSSRTYLESWRFRLMVNRTIGLILIGFLCHDASKCNYR